MIKDDTNRPSLAPRPALPLVLVLPYLRLPETCQGLFRYLPVHYPGDHFDSPSLAQTCGSPLRRRQLLAKKNPEK